MKRFALVLGSSLLTVLSGAAQDAVTEEIAPEPVWTLSNAGGLVEEAFDLQVTCDAAGAVLRFSQDGSPPTVESDK